MTKNRLEAFSDGVLAIILTIMVLEMKEPEGTTLAALVPVLPVFLSYILSFIYIGIYWNNHHHLLHTVRHVNGSILWANLHLLFWLSLVPFVTAWAGENHFTTWPIVLYGLILLGAAFAYYLLTKTIISHHDKDSLLARAVGNKLKEKILLILYTSAIPIAFWAPALSSLIYIAVAIIWIIPDKRIEKVLETSH